MQRDREHRQCEQLCLCLAVSAISERGRINGRCLAQVGACHHGLFMLLMVLATLGFGEHYLVDLVAAVPLSPAVQAAWTTGLPWKAPQLLECFHRLHLPRIGALA